jgi:UDPglucose 6-dehydrogenase
MFNTISGKKIAILGFAFKKDTGDTRETPAIDVTNGLIRDRALVSVYDPQVRKGSGSRLEPVQARISNIQYRSLP